MRIKNLTQHKATEDQKLAGVEDCEGGQPEELLTFTSIPTQGEIWTRAKAIAHLARGYDAAMIGGFGPLLSQLEEALRMLDVRPVHAFSQREMVEQTQPDGSVRKVAIFRHLGFVGLDGPVRPARGCTVYGTCVCP